MLALLLALAACGDSKNEVGSFSNDLLGNEIKIEALPDPAIPSVVCHMARFERSVLDRARQGNWFEDPSNSAVACQRTGPIDLRGVDLGRGGDEIFSERQSLFFKRTAVRRIVDLDNRSILYVSHSREIIEGSAKMSISSVQLTPEEVAAARAPK
jgi:CreA protein